MKIPLPTNIVSYSILALSVFAPCILHNTRAETTLTGDYQITGKLRTNNSTNAGSGATALGGGNIASGATSVAAGNSNTSAGNNSIALGYKDIASLDCSIALGQQNESRAIRSITLGTQNIADADMAMAFGYGSDALGIRAVAIGQDNVASGQNSFAFGYNSTAEKGYSFVFGKFNQVTGSVSTGWILTEPLFVLGNGTSASSRSNAFTVLKNGNIGVGVAQPIKKLEVAGDASFTGAVRIAPQGDLSMGEFTVGP